MDTELDILNRGSIVERIVGLLQGLRTNKQSMAFSLNGKWGSGKTFVMKLLAERLRVENNNLNDDEQKFCFIRYDCWKYDYYSEPLIALVSAMSNELAEGTKQGNSYYVGKELKQVGKKLAKWGIKAGGIFLQAKTGIDIVPILSQIMNDINEVSEKSMSRELTIERELDELRKILREICTDNTMVIVVDELDRCLPEYMIRVLERLHHLFEGMDNIVLIIATDRMQLEHTIKQIYGENTDAGAYLQKMIQFELTLDFGEVQNEEILKKKFANYVEKFEVDKIIQEPTLIDFFEAVFKGIEIRRIIQWIDKISLVHSLSFGDKKTGYDILFYELFWTVFTKIYQFYPSSEIIQIDIKNPFIMFYSSCKDEIKKSVIPLIKYLGERIGKIHVADKPVVKNTPIKIYDDANAFNMMFWYWTWLVTENKQRYSLPRIPNQQAGYQLQSEANEKLECLKRFQELMEIIN